MNSDEREHLEEELRRRAERGEHEAVAALGLRSYGPEIYGFLVGFHRNEQDAADVFSIFSERLWRGLRGFGWECSFRTWAYAIARNTSCTYRRDAARRAKHEAPLPEGSVLCQIAEEVRSGTRSYLKTEAKQLGDRLRQSLSRDDAMLLTLRVDRRLSWNDAARILHDGDEPLDDETLKREAARLRKRFQDIKSKLLAMKDRAHRLEEVE